MRILVVEDEMIIGMDMAIMLEGWGHTPDGPHKRPATAIEAISNDPPDFAILDVNLGQAGDSMAVAEVLNAAGTPFVFLTGYDSSRFSDREIARIAPHLRKPVAENELRALVDRVAATKQA